MAIFWANDFISGNNQVKLEIMIGERIIGDKMYYKVNGSKPVWFDLHDTPVDYITRELIIQKGLDLIKERFGNIPMKFKDGRSFNWHEV